MAVRERKFFVGGNWKMNGSKALIDKILDGLKEGNVSSDTGSIKSVNAQDKIEPILIVSFFFS